MAVLNAKIEAISTHLDPDADKEEEDKSEEEKNSRPKRVSKKPEFYGDPVTHGKRQYIKDK